VKSWRIALAAFTILLGAAVTLVAGVVAALSLFLLFTPRSPFCQRLTRTVAYCSNMSRYLPTTRAQSISCE
jgi:hypothetical protein